LRLESSGLMPRIDRRRSYYYEVMHYSGRSMPGTLTSCYTVQQLGGYGQCGLPTPLNQRSINHTKFHSGSHLRSRAKCQLIPISKKLNGGFDIRKHMRRLSASNPNSKSKRISIASRIVSCVDKVLTLELTIVSTYCKLRLTQLLTSTAWLTKLSFR